MEIAVLGSGAFGTALAFLLEARGHHITLWARNPETASKIAAAGESSRLAGIRLGPNVTATADLASAVAGKPIVLVVTPSQTVRSVVAEAAPHIHPDAIVVCASKGIEESTLATMDRVFRDTLAPAQADRACFLSGPTFAKELVQGLPAAIVVASHDRAAAQTVQENFASDVFRVYWTEDVIGVEIAGALKNVVAIAAGITDGLGYGHNTRAAVITRGLAEISRLGVKLGANPLTFLGLAGVGDLVLTCTGDLSRNRTVGLELGRGKTLREIMAGMSAVAEGVKTTPGARALAAKAGVEMPITDAIHAVLHEDKRAAEAVRDLMRRDLRAERG